MAVYMALPVLILLVDEAPETLAFGSGQRPACRRAGDISAGAELPAAAAEVERHPGGPGEKQQQRPEPEQPGRRLHWRLQQYEIAVARGQVVPDRGIAVAGDDPFANQHAEVAGEIGPRLGDGLVQIG